MIGRIAMAFFGEGPGLVTVSGETVNSTGAGTAIAGIVVNADGTIDKIESGSTTQIDAATDWVIPNALASSLYEVRVTSVNHNGGPGWLSSPGADGTWFDLSTDRTWSIQAIGASTPLTTDFTLEIRWAGATQDTGSYILNASYF